MKLVIFAVGMLMLAGCHDENASKRFQIIETGHGRILRLNVDTGETWEFIRLDDVETWNPTRESVVILPTNQ